MRHIAGVRQRNNPHAIIQPLHFARNRAVANPVTDMQICPATGLKRRVTKRVASGARC
jgi:hypothetical protein